MCEQGSKLTQIRLAHTTKSLKTHAFVDPCIAHIIQMFNDNGYQTVASCCGHGKRPGVISLENGTELILCYSYKQTRMVEKLYPGLHEEMDGKTPPPMNVDDYEKLVNELEGENDHFQAFIKELGEENADLVKKRDVDYKKMKSQWETLQEAEKEVTFLKGLNLARIEKCGELDTENKELEKDRDGQKAGWDASTGVVNHLIKEIVELTKTIDVLRDGYTQDELDTIQDYKTKIIKERAENVTLKVTISALRTASKFKKEYDPKWQNKVKELEEVILKNQESTLKLEAVNADLKLGFHNMEKLHIDEKKEITCLKAANVNRIIHSKRLSDEINRLKDEVKSLGEVHVEAHVLNTEINNLKNQVDCLHDNLKDSNKERDRIHGHWHRQTSGYMAKIKNQRRQLKNYQKHSHRLTERINTLYPYLAHGTKDHRKWLRKAIEEHFDMYRPDPKPKLTMTLPKWDGKGVSQGGLFEKGGSVDGT